MQNISISLDKSLTWISGLQENLWCVYVITPQSLREPCQILCSTLTIILQSCCVHPLSHQSPVLGGLTQKLPALPGVQASLHKRYSGAKISTASLFETLRRDQEVRPSLDHFTQEIMYFYKVVSLQGRDGVLTVLISHQALQWFIYAFAGSTRRDIHYGTLRKPLYLPESPPQTPQTVQGSWGQATAQMMLPSYDSVTEYQESHSHYTVPVCG